MKTTKATETMKVIKAMKAMKSTNFHEKRKRVIFNVINGHRRGDNDPMVSDPMKPLPNSNAPKNFDPFTIG
jgi:hypothetical protein